MGPLPSLPEAGQRIVGLPTRRCSPPHTTLLFAHGAQDKAHERPTAPNTDAPTHTATSHHNTTEYHLFTFGIALYWPFLALPVSSASSITIAVHGWALRHNKCMNLKVQRIPVLQRSHIRLSLFDIPWPDCAWLQHLQWLTDGLCGRGLFYCRHAFCRIGRRLRQRTSRLPGCCLRLWWSAVELLRIAKH